jgi:thiamine pyrophosphokinase
LVNALVLTNAQFRPMKIKWMTGQETVHVIWDRATIDGRVGDLLTLVAMGRDATGVTTSGLRWPLRSARLAAACSRGLSNELTEPHARVSVATGTLFAIHTPS